MSEVEFATKHWSPWSWFSLSSPVDRVTYATVGFGLAMVKYVTEATVVYATTEQFFSPIDFVNPWLNSKAPFLAEAPNAGLLWLLFTLPFVWIAIAMSVRRAADAGISPWLGLVMLIPLVNLAVMCVLAVLPTGAFRPSMDEVAENERRRRQLAAAFGPPSTAESQPLPSGSTTFVSVIIAIAAGCATQVVVGGISVWAFELYGFILFFCARHCRGCGRVRLQPTCDIRSWQR